MVKKMGIIQIAKMIKDEEARNILSHPEDFPDELVEYAKSRFDDEERGYTLSSTI